MAKPDKAHIHHQLLKRTSSQRTTVLIIYLVQALFSFAAIIYTLHNQKLGYLIYGVLMVIVIIFMLKTDVVFDFPSKEKELAEKIKNRSHK